jgi:hypothetical protein
MQQIRAAPIGVFTGLAAVPTKAMIFSLCWSALKNRSICQRS